MAEIVNLRRARKARARADEAAKAEENRIAFGRPKAGESLQRRREALERGRLEGHRLEPGPGDSDGAA